MSHIEFFTNDKFKVLLHIYNSLDKNGVAHLTQQEVADELGLSRMTINGIFAELKMYDYIFQEKHVGRYRLTYGGYDAIEQITR